MYMSVDKGVTWQFNHGLPVGQFYHVAYDLKEPYNVYGGLQDNGSWTAPSAAPAGAAGYHTLTHTHWHTHAHIDTHKLQCQNWLFVYGSVRGAHLLQKGSPRPRFQIGFMHNHTAGV